MGPNVGLMYLFDMNCSEQHCCTDPSDWKIQSLLFKAAINDGWRETLILTVAELLCNAGSHSGRTPWPIEFDAYPSKSSKMALCRRLCSFPSFACTSSCHVQRRLGGRRGPSQAPHSPRLGPRTRYNANPVPLLLPDVHPSPPRCPECLWRM